VSGADVRVRLGVVVRGFILRVTVAARAGTPTTTRRAPSTSSSPTAARSGRTHAAAPGRGETSRFQAERATQARRPLLPPAVPPPHLHLSRPVYPPAMAALLTSESIANSKFVISGLSTLGAAVLACNVPDHPHCRHLILPHGLIR